MKTNVKLEKIGDVLVHGGQIDHEGAKEVTSGLRYTLVYFLNINKGCCWQDLLIGEAMNKSSKYVCFFVFLFLLFLFINPNRIMVF